MRTARVLTGAVLAIAALGLPYAPALADSFGKLELSPSSVRPGATVTVNTTACGADGHGTGDASAVGGPASFELKPGTHKEDVVGQFTVPESAKPGTYGIGAKCDNGKEATGDLVVTAGRGSSSPSAMPSTARSAMPSAVPSTPASPPMGGMKTGAGGTSDGSGTVEIVAGAAVLATAAVAGAWFLRRRNQF
ncbi:hypothetical protein LE181_17040 [Streptomyces sp. SCA3-4]|uniref:hypothetical protein n=1 Tax=Streptomyces sichuanensis TaxID=2871810 RepID=UPI001CE301F2|nr:hypothetical protein [Streptomyces sichuanensis]MCA6093858.1 hypothetical protein [Streptomyces sichuanensis]